MMMQTIPTHTWTKLIGYEIEAYHDKGSNWNVWVEDGVLKAAVGANVLLRPTGGTYTPGWRAPIRGIYHFGARSGARVGGANLSLGPDQIVVQEASWFTDHTGRQVFSGPQIAMNSGGALIDITQMGRADMPIVEIAEDQKPTVR